MSKIIYDYNEAVFLLKRHDIVALPTETVYGLAARADSDEAIGKIYKCKNRPEDHPLIVHVAKNWDLANWVLPYPGYVDKLINVFWPGPLTLVFNIKENSLSNKINKGLSTIAVRCPDHPLIQQVLSDLQIPLAAPSANLYGKVSPTCAQHVKESLLDDNLKILDGGVCKIGIESTILLVTDDKNVTILRPGMISAKDIAKYLPGIDVIEKINSDMPISGNKIIHYQPEKPLHLFSNINKIYSFYQTIGSDAVVWLYDKIPNNFDEVHYLWHDPDLAAVNLYKILRDSDDSVKNNIILQLPPDKPEWFAIRERLFKAGLLHE